jgi:Mg2+/citrate symporter
VLRYEIRIIPVVYVAIMIALIVGLDVTLLKHHFWERLAVNIGIVLVFAGFYFRVLRGS